MTEDLTYPISQEELRELFAAYLRRVPTSLAVRSAMRVMGLSKFIPKNSLVLDVGCGDGCFGDLYPKEAGLTIDGLDLSVDELRLARMTGAYRDVREADISSYEPEGRYDVALGNCSMEHVPDIHAALRNIHQSLRPGGALLLSVPAFGWARTLSPVAWLERRSTRLGMAAAGGLDGFFQHHHLYGYNTWRMVLEGNGFQVRSMTGLGGEHVNRLFERGLPPALAEFLFKSVFKQYPGLLGRLRRMPTQAVLDDIWHQPISHESAHRIEYVIEAVRPA